MVTVEGVRCSWHEDDADPCKDPCPHGMTQDPCPLSSEEALNKHLCPICGSHDIRNQWCMTCGADLPGYKKRSLLSRFKSLLGSATPEPLIPFPCSERQNQGEEQQEAEKVG